VEFVVGGRESRPSEGQGVLDCLMATTQLVFLKLAAVTSGWFRTQV